MWRQWKGEKKGENRAKGLANDSKSYKKDLSLYGFLSFSTGALVGAASAKYWGGEQ